MIAALLPPYCRRIAAFAQARLKRFRALFAEDSALPTGFIHGDPSLDTNPNPTLTLPVPLTLNPYPCPCHNPSPYPYPNPNPNQVTRSSTTASSPRAASSGRWSAAEAYP